MDDKSKTTTCSICTSEMDTPDMKNRLVLFVAVLILWTNVYASPVPDTGQTQCYDDGGNVITCPSPGQLFYGQDANYTINPMSYTKLDLNGNALPNSATSWAMARDNVTGLIWEVKNNKDGIQNYNDLHDADNTYTWYDSDTKTNGGNPGTQGNGTDIEDFINALNNANFGGYNDWRLPTIKELAYICNYNVPYPGPTIDTEYFPNTAASSYWSSTTYANNSTNAWFMNYNLGYVDNADKRNSFFALAVRGLQILSIYKDHEDGTVTDSSTHLTWQQDSFSGKTWENALAYCKGLNLGGYTDWRLPTIKELRSLVDYIQDNPAIDTTKFPGKDASWYWSSTTYASGEILARGVLFSDGSDKYYIWKNSEASVRAVRGGQVLSQPPCTVSLSSNLAFSIPYIDFNNGQLVLSTDFIFDPNPSYPNLIIFKLTKYSIINNSSFSCTPTTMSGDLAIHIPDLVLPDGVTHLWTDLTYNPVLSTDGNFY